MTERPYIKAVIFDLHTHSRRFNSKAIQSICLAAMSFEEALIWKPEFGQYYSIGIHPWNLSLLQWNEENISRMLIIMEKLATYKEVVAIGEAGLDKLRVTDRVEQQICIQLLLRQIQISEALGKPLILHLVKAQDDILALRKKLHPSQPWIVHGFGGKPTQASQLLAAGIEVSLGLHFNPSTARFLPAENLFLETDNAGVNIYAILDAVAKARGEDKAAVNQIVNDNILRVFHLPSG